VIARRYLTGWFILDICSIFPSFFDIIPVIEGSTASNVTLAGNGTLIKTASKSPVTSLRVIRALRLIKLVRLLRTPWGLLKRLFVRFATPRATVTVLSLVLECLVVAHWLACVLGMAATFLGTPLETWLATHGYCKQVGIDTDGDPVAACVSSAYIYLQCLWWSVGMLMGAPISMRPDKGPYPRYFFSGDNEVELRTHEQVVVIVLKLFCAFHWTTIIARFVFVYNNLDPDQREFRLGWDHLNRFCSFFNLEQRFRIELRQYYLERADEVKAKSRRKVMNKFSPHLAEEVVWELDKQWLVRVPCFSLVAERVRGEQLRFLVKVALAMDAAVYVPKDRPPPRRLYIITQGTAMYMGSVYEAGRS